MEQLITGIHHITAITSSAQKNLEFYSGILGLRLVKKTVNYDAPNVYHLYYGDTEGHPGSLLTFFPYEGLVQGRQGKGMVNTTGFSVPLASLDYWMQRLRRFSIPFRQPKERFENEVVIYFEDYDGLGLELVFNDRDVRNVKNGGSTVPQAYAIRGLFHAELWLDSVERTAGILTTMLDHQLLHQSGNRYRYAALDAPGHYVDLLLPPETLKGLAGSGTVHHLAFATPNSGSQEQWREKASKLELTEIRNRNYFTSIYFREPGGVLFEVATAGPGFTADESEALLGQKLVLPSWFEDRRTEIEDHLKPISIHPEQYQ